jgi:putative ABC transport system permease protein
MEEVSYDKFHEKSKRIHRIVTTILEGGKETQYGNTQIPMAVELESKYTQVERATRFIGVGRELFENPLRDLKFYEEKFFFTDPSVFDIFSFNLISGNPATVLLNPNTAVITPETARRYFGAVDVIGKTFTSKGKEYTITGIVGQPPANSSIQFDGLLSISSFPTNLGTWDSWYPDTYVLIAEQHTVADVEDALKKITAQHVAPLFDGYGVVVQYWLQPITDIHLKSDFNSEGTGSYEYIYIFLAIAIFLVVIACINYINLATARAATRSKEIGIRKTIGSSKWHIMIQFVAESMLLTLISFVLSGVLVTLLLPYFNELAGKSVSLMYLLRPEIILGTFGLMLFIGLLGGSYPAFYLSQFNPIMVLKGNANRGGSNARLRKVLVSVQFAISIGMFICTAVVHDQLKYVRYKDLGFSREQVLHMELADSATMANEAVLVDGLKRSAQVVNVASSSSMPGKGVNYTVMIVEGPEGAKAQGVYHYYAGYDYIETMGLQMAEGRSFSKDYLSDSTAALVNEEMVKSMKWKDPIGKKLTENDGNPATVDRYYTVVGVVRDFHQNSLYSPITPLAIFAKEPNYFLNVKVRPDNLQSTLDFISKTWREVTDGKPFTYNFLDADFESLYQADQKRGQIFSVFSVICMAISCVGLFGLAAFTTEQRAKEISIRKVSGATISNIVRLFYIDFLKLVGVGVLIAFPVSYLAMNNWLQSFAYQTDLSWISFLSSALATILITMGSISFHTIRAARTNPAITLRRE